MLYPLKFNPLFEERIWGGDQLRRKMDKKLPEGKLIGESWELSAVPGNVSVVANGKLAGNSLEELIEVYMGELVGDKIYNKFGLLFPLLLKLIDAQDALSIQVHPNDKLALERHNSYGKTEMWYVIDSEKDAELCLGFNRPVTKEEYLRHVADGTLADILARVPVKPDNAYFSPAGAIHAIGKGILIAEIQQTSDITYRVLDWNRVDKNGKGRELHTDLAADAINFAPDQHYDVTHKPEMNRSVNLVECPYFTTNVIEVKGQLVRSYEALDSFVIYMILEGNLTLKWNGGSETAVKGETILIPACIEQVTLEGEGKLLEIYID